MPIAKRTASSARSWPMMPGTSGRSAVVPKEKEAGSERRQREPGGRGGRSRMGPPDCVFYGLTPGPVRVDLGVRQLDGSTIRRPNVFLRKTLAPAAAGAILLATAFTLASPA